VTTDHRRVDFLRFTSSLWLMAAALPGLLGACGTSGSPGVTPSVDVYSRNWDALDSGTADGAVANKDVLVNESKDSTGQADAVGSDAGASDVGGPVDAAPATCPGAPGCSCAAPPDCDDGLCIETPLGRRCAEPCGDTCPAAWACAKLDNNAGKTVDVCVPGWGRLCQPCAASKDCEAAGITGALCVDEGPLGLFCGAACNNDSDCPTGYGCLVMNSTEGTKAKQCVRLPPPGSADAYGVCSCWPASKANGLATYCYAEQVDLSDKVVGKCPGQRICGQTGLGKCILVGAKAEVCDGIDNDCNGKVDDDAGGCAADEACVKGKCTKKCSPVDGGWSAWVWGACSAACGGGKKTGTRQCDTPAPGCGGKACVGDASKTETCNEQPCPTDTLPKGTSVYSKGGQTVGGAVPAGVTVAKVSIWGAGGGGCFPGNGGGGAYVSVSIPVKAGDSLELRVASAGSATGGGGGASYVSKNGVQLVIAGGGGGAGCDGCSGCSGSAKVGAGGGGGKVGGSGQSGAANNAYKTNSGGGAGGSASQGGVGGKQNNASKYSGCEVDGSAGSKDAGGACAGGYKCKPGPQAKAQSGGASCKGNGTGGAGGAGRHGGGSGAAKYTYSGGGGGGGSSWADATVTVVSSEAGNFDLPGGSAAPGYTASAARGGLGKQKAFAGKPEAGKPGLIVLTL